MRIIVLLLVLLAVAVPAAALEAGDRAPDFEAESTDGTIRLSDFAGKKNVVLAFYYKDFTGG